MTRLFRTTIIRHTGCRAAAAAAAAAAATLILAAVAALILAVEYILFRVFQRLIPQILYYLTSW